MRFVIVGAGRVGLRTARSVTDSGHEVVVVESDPERAERARTEGFEVVEGNGGLEETLRSAGIETADGLGALTGDLNANFAACAVANEYGCRTVMRIDEDYREDVYRTYVDSVDAIIYPERLGAILAKNALVGGNSRAIADIERNLQVVEFTIAPDAPMRGYTLSELELPGRARLLAFGPADGKFEAPTPDEMLGVGDRLVVLADSDSLDDIRRIIAGDAGRTVAGGV